MKSNNYNTLNVFEYIKNNKMYMILHNIGRIITLRQPLADRYLNVLPMNTEKSFHPTICSQSSIGLQLNLLFSRLVLDLLTLYSKSSSKLTIEERKVIETSLKTLELDIENFYMGGNETFNVISIQRILSSIIKTQSELIATSS